MTSASQRLTELLTGFWTTQATYTAVALGLANHMSTTELRPVSALADSTSTNVDALRRLLAFLGACEIVEGSPETGYRLSSTGALLRDDADGSMSAHVRMYGDYFYRCWASLLHVIQSGRPAFDRTFGTDLFTYLAEHPGASRDYEQMMIGGAPYFADLDRICPFTGDETVVDVGGGHGALLAELLSCHPTMSAILFDAPHVIDETETSPIATEFADRCQRVGGDFFKNIPSGGDVYVLSRILHCFDDPACARILARCGESMKPEGRLLVLERIMENGADSLLTCGFNLHMLTVLGGGRERGVAEFEKLLTGAGFALLERHSLSLGMHVLVAAPS